jgi:hypothetical protein
MRFRNRQNELMQLRDSGPCLLSEIKGLKGGNRAGDIVFPDPVVHRCVCFMKFIELYPRGSFFCVPATLQEEDYSQHLEG